MDSWKTAGYRRQEVLLPAAQPFRGTVYFWRATGARRLDQFSASWEHDIMAIRVVRLGTPRHPDEGLRIGTVRRPPRGVPKSQYAKDNWYDVWFPNLAPSPATMKLGQSAETGAQWTAFKKKYRAEMARPDATHAIELLARLSQATNFSIGCYCEDESRCHRSVLRRLLTDAGAKLA